MKGRGSRGFTLIELSLVLLIVGTVLYMGLVTGSSVVASARLMATQNKMKAIGEALMAYRTTNDRLPCPASLTINPGNANYGIEGTNPGTCTGGTPAANFSAAGTTNTGQTAAEGAVPAATLGIPPDFMVDGWGNRFRYAVDVSMTVGGVFASTNIGCNNNAITVYDVNGNARTTGAVYALISHGPNGHGAYTTHGATVNAGSVNTNELTNCHCTSGGVASTYSPTYVQMLVSASSSNPLNSFDDLVAFKERWHMQREWDKTGNCSYLYVADNTNNRVEMFNLIGTYLGQFGSSGSGNGQFNGAWGAGVDASGNLWVADTYNNRMEKFNAAGQFITTLGSHGWTNGYLDDPTNVTVDPNGNIWVFDMGNARAEEFNSSGSYVNQAGCASGSCATGTANGQFGGGTYSALTSDTHGNIWVTDSANNRVEEFNNSASWLQSIGGPSPYTCETSPSGSAPACAAGSGNGQFTEPMGIATDSSGNVYVCDYGNNRIEKFNSSGAYQNQFGTSGSGSLNAPTAIAIDTSGDLWVVDSGHYRVVEFNSSGTYLSQLGCASGDCSSGSGSGQFSSPLGIAIGSR